MGRNRAQARSALVVLGLATALASSASPGVRPASAQPEAGRAASAGTRLDEADAGSPRSDERRVARDGRPVGQARAVSEAVPFDASREASARAEAASLSPGSGLVILVAFVGLIAALLFQWGGDGQKKKETA